MLVIPMYINGINMYDLHSQRKHWFFMNLTIGTFCENKSSKISCQLQFSSIPTLMQQQPLHIFYLHRYSHLCHVPCQSCDPSHGLKYLQLPFLMYYGPETTAEEEVWSVQVRITSLFYGKLCKLYISGGQPILTAGQNQLLQHGQGPQP